MHVESNRAAGSMSGNWTVIGNCCHVPFFFFFFIKVQRLDENNAIIGATLCIIGAFLSIINIGPLSEK